MTIIPAPGAYTYVADSGDWRIYVGDGMFTIMPQVGMWTYESGANLDTLAQLIIDAKAHAVANGINWGGN